MISEQDLRRAVQAGLISTAQAEALLRLAATPPTAAETEALAPSEGANPALPPRLGSEARWAALTAPVAAGREEPLVLYRGFNEIFIVIGLLILYGGWLGLFWVDLWRFGDPDPLQLVLVQAVTLVVLWFGQRYFTLTRAMLAPSITLAVLTAVGLAQLGAGLGLLLDLPLRHGPGLAAAATAAGMLMHYRQFRLPFDAALIALAVYAGVGALFGQGGGLPGLLPGSGLPMPLSLGLGAACFALAMRFDLSDPLRRTARSATGFWLHMAAALAIVSPVAMELIDGGRAEQMLLLAFLGLLALIALVVDRRSLLVSGASYAVWLLFELTSGSLLTILLLGLGLVLLGTQWERLRAVLLHALPDFPGKSRLPPYGIDP